MAEALPSAEIDAPCKTACGVRHLVTEQGFQLCAPDGYDCRLTEGVHVASPGQG